MHRARDRGQPEVLLLDEPTRRSTRSPRRKIEELIAELKADYTIAIVTHNMQQAARVSDYTAYMYLGELMEFGETDQIFLKPKRKEPRTTSPAASAECRVRSSVSVVESSVSFETKS